VKENLLNEERLSLIKEVLVEKSWLMHVLMTSKAVFTGTLREVQESGEAPELDRLVVLDNQKKEREWFPEVVELVGKHSSLFLKFDL
jgi:hypothetical protein